MPSKGEIEAALCKSMATFAREYMGRGPNGVRCYIVAELLLVRFQGALTTAEKQLVNTMPAAKGRNLLKSVRAQLIETARPILGSLVQEITGQSVISLHHDISTTTGEELIVFTLDGPPPFR